MEENIIMRKKMLLRQKKLERKKLEKKIERKKLENCNSCDKMGSRFNKFSYSQCYWKDKIEIT